MCLLLIGTAADARAEAVERALGLRPGALRGEVRLSVLLKIYLYVSEQRCDTCWDLPPCAGVGGPSRVRMVNGWWPQSVVALCEGLGAPRVLRARLLGRIGISGFKSAGQAAPSPCGGDPPLGVE